MSCVFIFPCFHGVCLLVCLLVLVLQCFDAALKKDQHLAVGYFQRGVAHHYSSRCVKQSLFAALAL